MGILRVSIASRVEPELHRRAAACGLSPSAWVGEVVHATLAEARCQHGEPRAEPPPRPGSEEASTPQP